MCDKRRAEQPEGKVVPVAWMCQLFKDGKVWFSTTDPLLNDDCPWDTIIPLYAAAPNNAAISQVLPPSPQPDTVVTTTPITGEKTYIAAFDRRVAQRGSQNRYGISEIGRRKNDRRQNTAPSTPATPSKLPLTRETLLKQQAWARQDDWDKYFVGSDIRLLIGQAFAAIELERKEKDDTILMRMIVELKAENAELKCDLKEERDQHDRMTEYWNSESVRIDQAERELAELKERMKP